MNRNECDVKINQLLDDAEQLIPNELLTDLPFMPEAPDIYDWHEFEQSLLDKGEEIRRLILESKKKPAKDLKHDGVELTLHQVNFRSDINWEDTHFEPV